jgi:hypothetical protein
MISQSNSKQYTAFETFMKPKQHQGFNSETIQLSFRRIFLYQEYRAQQNFILFPIMCSLCCFVPQHLETQFTFNENIQSNLGSRTPRITNNSVYEQIFRTQSVSDDVLCLQLRTRKPSTRGAISCEYQRWQYS